MTTRQRKRSTLSRYILPTFAICFLGYFAFHLFHGTYGVLAQRERVTVIADLEKELQDLVKDRTSLERRVSLLSASSLDRDTIDEYARAKLNLAKPNEITILLHTK